MLRALPVVLLLATPALAVDPAGPDPRTVVRYGPAYKYPQAGWTVLHVEGEPYDRGYQHGRLMADEIAGYLKCLAAQQSHTAPADGWALTRTLVNVAFLRKFDREYLEEMKGIADGAAAAGAKAFDRPVDLLDVVCMNMNPEYDTLDSALHALPTGLEGHRWTKPSPQAMPKPNQEHCSAFAATGPATADGKIVFGHITMWSLYSTNHYNVWLDVQPAKGHRVLMQSYPAGIQSGMDYYIASSGLMVTETTIRQTRFNPDGTPLANRIRKVLQYANSIDDAVKMLTEKNNGLYANEWLLGDANTNEIAILELGTNAWKLRRSSKNEWLNGGMPGFYWGCNNTKDLAVRLDTYPGTNDRPQNVAWRPSDRDQAWLKLLTKHHGKIDAAFGRLAFTTPPLAAHPSLDAKVTTTDMVKSLKTVALFGPPLGKVWRPTFDQRQTYSDIKALVPNDWTVLSPIAPPTTGESARAVDFVEWAAVPADPPTVPAWHGTLLPKTEDDVWLTAGFAEFERIVALENALKERSNGKLTKEDEDRLALARVQYTIDYTTARAALLPVEERKKMSPFDLELDRARAHKLAVGYGVFILDCLRYEVGAGPFDAAMEEFGKTHAGKEVTTSEFVAFLSKASNKDLAKVIENHSTRPGHTPRTKYGVNTFEEKPEHTLIVYGLGSDEAANKEAAEELQKRIRDAWSNVTVAIESDGHVSEDYLKTHHVILIGRPAANGIVAKYASKFPVTFTPGTFTVNGDLFAHPGSAVIAAAPNPLAEKYSFVVVAGLSADSTFHATEHVMDAPAAEVVVIPAKGASRVVVVK
jgi:hypothetical protein